MQIFHETKSGLTSISTLPNVYKGNKYKTFVLNQNVDALCERMSEMYIETSELIYSIFCFVCFELQIKFLIDAHSSYTRVQIASIYGLILADFCNVYNIIIIMFDG